MWLHLSGRQCHNRYAMVLQGGISYDLNSVLWYIQGTWYLTSGYSALDSTNADNILSGSVTPITYKEGHGWKWNIVDEHWNIELNKWILAKLKMTSQLNNIMSSIMLSSWYL